MLLLYFEESGWNRLTSEQQQQGLAAYQAYVEALTNADVLRGTNSLAASSSATSVRIEDGRTQVLDGPFIDSKEQLGGYFIIDVPDLDAAIAWAARCPGATHGTVEVRPLGRHLETAN